MSIQMACPFCERPHKVDNKYAGKRILCKRCGKAIRVPQAGAAGGTSPVAVKPPSVASAPAVAEAPAPTVQEPPAQSPPAVAPPAANVPEFKSAPETKPVDAEAELPRGRISEIAAAAQEAELPAPLPSVTVAPEAIASPAEAPVEPHAEAPLKEQEQETGAEPPILEVAPMETAPPDAAPPVSQSPEPSAPLTLEVDEQMPIGLPAAVDAAPSLVAAMPEEQPVAVAPAPEVSAPVEEEDTRESSTAAEIPQGATTLPEETIPEPVPEATAAPEIVPSGAMMLTVPAHVLPTTDHVPGDSPTGLAGRRAMGPPQGPGAVYLKEIMLHLNQTVGRVARVFHESIPSNTPIDLQVVVPSNYGTREAHPRGNSFFTVVTSGLSNQPMNLPAGAPASMSRYAELMICLPMTWLGMTMDGLFDVDLMRDEKNWWPMRWLKAAARMPHEHNTFLAPGHMIPNGTAAAPVAANTRLGGVLVMPSEIHPKSHRLVVNEQVTIDFYALWPIYPEEFQLRQEKGLDALLGLLASSGVTELVQLRRKNVAAGS